MTKVADTIGSILAKLSDAMGLYGMVIFYFGIALLSLFAFIKKDYMNVVLSKVLRPEYDKVKAKYRTDPNTPSEEEATFLILNKYSTLTVLWTTLMKVLLVAIFAFGMGGEAMKAYTSNFPFDFSNTLLKVLQTNTDVGVYFFIAIGISFLIQYYMAGTLSHTLVKSDGLGIISVALNVAACVFLPVAGSVMIAALTLAQYIIVLINLTKLKDKNIANASRKIVMVKSSDQVKKDRKKNKK